ncbi:MAG: alpha-1,2-fucosyltransferase [Methanobrevibacter sp.]|jgi:glutaredoxin|nr:alpha-1,2-fucosyltransferase [Candidatus Methanoflexus mossambicus]
MITVELGGGMGNQMFQYAMAKSLAHDLDDELNIFYNTDMFYPFLKVEKHQRYNLNHLNIDENFTSAKRFYYSIFSSKFKNNFYLFGEKRSFPFIYRDLFKHLKRKNDSITKKNKNSVPNIFLRGGWTNEKYFHHNQDIIRESFKITTPPNRQNKRLMDEISSKNSIALCVRRGDYTNPFHKAQFGLSTINYFNNAMELIAKKIDNPVFYVFSNDSQYVQKNISSEYPLIFITHNGVDKDYEDLRLMSCCKHFIISNSTFHWWGAYLSLNKNKIIIAPSPWNNSYAFEDIIPDDWIRIKCDRSECYNNLNKLIFELNDYCLFGNTSNSKFFNLLLNSKAVFNFNFITDSDNFYHGDKYLKLIIDAPNDGILKLNCNEVDSIFIGYYKGLSERYICLDKIISLNNIKLINMGESSINLKYIGLKY